jgi:tellurite resistance protein TehA-like permease
MVAGTLRANDFEAAWYLSIVAAGMLALAVPSAVYAAKGARRIWRAGDHGPALVVAAASALGMLFFIALLALASVALLRREFG